MNEFRADLHCHSTCSDGSDTPEELIRLAMSIGLNALSITDHDTIEAYSQAAPLASALGFPLLPGVELSSTFQGESIHILGYSFPCNSQIIYELCERQKRMREERNVRILEKLKKLKIVITLEELKELAGGSVAIGRPHIAMMMMKKGVISSLREGFDRYLGDGKCAYDPGERIEVQEVIDWIKKAKGLAVLAHPHLINRQRLLKALLQMPFDGIECYYSRMTSGQEKPFIAIAEKNGWLKTGGSDYHGKIKPLIALGCSWVEKSAFDQLYDHYLRVSQ